MTTTTRGGTMTDRRRQWLPWLLLLLMAAAVLWADHRRQQAVEKAEAATDQAQQARHSVDSLLQLEAALRERYAGDTAAFQEVLVRWKRLAARARGVDTLPGGVDTVEVPVEVVIAVADSTIRACEAVVSTCEQRVAVATERGDSAVSEARHWEEAAAQWKKASRGPFLRPAVEGTLTPGLDWQAAGEVTLGRGRLKVLARVDVGEGQETCAFVANTEAYTCSTPTEATARFGVRWGL